MGAGQDHLEGAGPVEADVAGVIDHAHPAAAQHADDLITRDRGHDPIGPISRGGSRAVRHAQQVARPRGPGVAGEPGQLAAELRDPSPAVGQFLQGLLARGAALEVPIQLVELGVNQAVIQEPIEQLSVRAVAHSSFSSMRTSARIIRLTSLLAV